MFSKYLKLKSLCVIILSWSVFWGAIFVFRPDDNVFKKVNLDSVNTPRKKNFIESVSIWQPYKKKSNRPAFALSFDSLKTENDKVGFFRSGLKRKLEIKNLKIKLFSKSSKNIPIQPSNSKKEISTNQEAIESKAPKKDYIFKYLLNKISGNDNGKLSSKGIIIDHGVDFKNLFSFQIMQFEFKEFFDKKPGYHISCAMAENLIETNEISLRGKVVIRTTGGLEIKTNNAVWDIRDEKIYIKSRYFAQRKNNFDTGKCLTVNLNSREMESNNNSI